MKKVLAVIILFCTLLGNVCAEGKIQKSKSLQSQIEKFIQENKSLRGVESIKLGSASLSVVRLFAKMEGDLDADSVEMMSLINGVKKIIILDYDDASFADHARIQMQLDEILKTTQLLMELREDDDIVKIYCDISEESDNITHFVLEADDVLICAFGKISKKHLLKMYEQANL